MPFGDIVANTKTYEPRSPGVYSESTVNFGDPDNNFLIRGANKQSRDGLLRATVSRVLYKDVTVGDDTQRLAATVSLQIAVPVSGFTAAEIDGMASDIDVFISQANVTRLFQGES